MTDKADKARRAAEREEAEAPYKRQEAAHRTLQGQLLGNLKNASVRLKRGIAKP